MRGGGADSLLPEISRTTGRIRHCSTRRNVIYLSQHKNRLCHKSLGAKRKNARFSGVFKGQVVDRELTRWVHPPPPPPPTSHTHQGESRSEARQRRDFVSERGKNS